MIKSLFVELRFIKYYKYIALFFSYFSDIIYNVVENKKIVFKKWKYKLTPKISFDKDLGLICEKIHEQFKELLTIQSQNKFSGQNYTTNLTDNLNKNILLEIKKHFSQKKYINRAKDYLGFKPKIRLINIYANLPGKANEENIGSKAYHRDSNCYRLYEIFFAITNINESNGPFFFVKNLELQNRCKIFYSSNMLNGDWATDGRIKEYELQKLNSSKIKYGKFIGVPGSTIELNTGVTFHKGGHVKEGYRIVGRVIYGGIEYKIDKDTHFLTKLLIKMHNLIEYTLGRYYVKI